MFKKKKTVEQAASKVEKLSTAELDLLAGGGCKGCIGRGGLM